MPRGYGILIYPVGPEYQPPFLLQEGSEYTRHFYTTNEKADEIADLLKKPHGTPN